MSNVNAILNLPLQFNVKTVKEGAVIGDAYMTYLLGIMNLGDLNLYQIEFIQNNKSVCYTPDIVKAVKLLLLAAYRGSADAQYAILDLSRNLVIKTEPLMSQKWLYVAATQGHELAKAVISKVKLNTSLSERYYGYTV